MKIAESLHLALRKIRPHRHIQLVVDIGHYIRSQFKTPNTLHFNTKTLHECRSL